MKTIAKKRNPENSGSKASTPFFKKKGEQTFFAQTKSSSTPFFTIQPKLTIGQPNDKYEKEADAMADKVANTPLNKVVASSVVQKKCNDCENKEKINRKEEEEEVQTKPLVESITPMIQKKKEEEEEIQPKLDIQRQEEEEEEMQPKLDIQRQEEEEEEMQPKLDIQRQEEEEEEMQPKLDIQRQEEEEEEMQPKLDIQRQEEEEEELQAKSVLQRQEEGEEEELQAKTKNNQKIRAPFNFESKIKSSTSSGQPLPKNVKQEMESGFGVDFSSIRIHNDESAANLSKEIRAQAFTRGKDIFFNKGKFNPDTPQGTHLLAHELTHTIQQGVVATKKIEPKSDSNVESESKSSNADQGTLPGSKDTKPLTPDQPLQPPSNQQVPPTAASEEEKEKKEDVIEKAPSSPEEDPQFQEQLQIVEKKGKKQRRHEPKSIETTNTKRAAKAPVNEVEAYSQGRHIGQLEEEGSKIKPFDKESFKKGLKDRIKAISPDSLGAMDDFKSSGGVDRVKSSVKQDVQKERDNTAGTLEKKNEEKPDQTGIKEKDHAPMPGRPKPPSRGKVDETAATPKPKTADEWEQPAEQQIASFDHNDRNNNIDDKQLLEGDIPQPEFETYVVEKQKAKTTIAENIQTYRTEEQSTLDAQQKDTGEAGKKGLGGFAFSRKKDLEKIDKQQGDTIDKDELARQNVAKDLNDIFNITKSNVESTLSSMEKDVNTYFDKEAENAQNRFIDYVESTLDDYKDRRYSGIRGWGRWISDKWSGLPSEVNKFYVTGKNQYLAEMDIVIDNVAGLVVTGLNKAQQEIATGREKVQNYLKTLDDNLKEYGDELAEGIENKFDALESSIHSKQEQLIGDLAKKYTDNLKQVNAQIEKWKEANKGIADKIKDFALGIWQTIKGLAKLLWSVIQRIGNVVGKIIKAPVRFFKNLVKGVKRGFIQFKKNLPKYLKAALFNWLFGTMGKAGIQLPKNFDLKGIFSLILQVLGLGMAAIRARAVKILGEPIVQKLEKVGKVFKMLMFDGPAALIQHAKDKVKAFKEQVVNDIQTMVSKEIIFAGITFVLGMLTPVGAFIKACKGIYNLVKFFIDRAKDIVALIDAVLNSIGAMVAGKVQVAADKVEDALARFLPLGIGFLAGLVGVSGIAGKVRKIVGRIRMKIQQKVIDPVIKVAFNLAQKAGKFFGKTKLGKMAKSGTAFVKKKVVEAKKKGKKLVKSLIDFFGKKTKFITSNGESHSIYYVKKRGPIKLIVASSPKEIAEFLKWYESDNKIEPDSIKGKIIIDIRKYITNDISPLIKDLKKAKDKNKESAIQQKLLDKNVSLSSKLKILLGGDKDVGKTIESYLLEGLTGTYESMPKPTTDILTPDHQPQASILVWAANQPFFRANGNMAKRAAGRSKKGYTINLHENRHGAGRTFKSDGNKTKIAFIKKAEKSVEDIDNKYGNKLSTVELNIKKRDIVVDLILNELAEDIRVMKAVARKKYENKDIWIDIHEIKALNNQEKKKLMIEIRNRIINGEDQLMNQDLESLKKS